MRYGDGEEGEGEGVVERLRCRRTELCDERVKKIALLENEFTIEGGELTPTLKVKRRVIDEKYRSVIDQLYDEGQGGRN